MDDNLTICLVFGAIVFGVFLGFKIFKPQPQSTPLIPYQSNTEVWEWIDFKGRKRQISVTRDVKRHV